MTKRSPLVSIIVVNWNGIEVLGDCLKSLQKLDYPNWELIFVDNGSSDGSEKLLEQYKLPCKNKFFKKNETNRGFAQANNQGYRLSQGEYVLLLNNDTKVTPDFLSKLVPRIEIDELLAVIQPRIFVMDKPQFLDNAGSFLTWTGFLTHWGFMEKDRSEFNTEKEIFSAKGACMLIRKKVIEHVGLFDDDFGSYFEETDFCWRVHLAGYKILYYPQASILHKVGFSSKKQNQFDVNYHSLKNRLDSLIKNLSGFGLIKILSVHIFILVGLAFYYMLKLDFKKSLMIIRAFIWNLSNLSVILNKRLHVQKLRVISDPELNKAMMRPLRLSEMFSHFAKVEANFK